MPPLRRAASLVGAGPRAEPPLPRDTQPRPSPHHDGDLAGAAAAVELPPRPGTTGPAAVDRPAAAANTEAQTAVPEPLHDHGRSAHSGMPPLMSRPAMAPEPLDFGAADPLSGLKAGPIFDDGRDGQAEPVRILTPLMMRPPRLEDEEPAASQLQSLTPDRRPSSNQPAPEYGHVSTKPVRPSQAVTPPSADVPPRTLPPPPPAHAHIPRPPSAPVIPPPPVVAAKPERLGHVALIDDNGAESIQFPLVAGDNRIGSGEACQLRFPDDGFLAPVHCVVDVVPGKMTLRPIDFGNGVFVRISTPVELQHGDTLRIGQEVLRFERIDRLKPEINYAGNAETVGFALPRDVWGRLCQIGLGRQVANAYLLGAPDVFLGRERGDILFPRDGFVSGSHAVVSERNGRCFLKDLVSSNGTFVKVKHEMPLRNGDLFLLGRNLLRVHLGPPA